MQSWRSTGGGSWSAGAGRFLLSGAWLPAGCGAPAVVYVKPSVAGRDGNNNDVVDAQNIHLKLGKRWIKKLCNRDKKKREVN